MKRLLLVGLLALSACHRRLNPAEDYVCEFPNGETTYLGLAKDTAHHDPGCKVRRLKT